MITITWTDGPAGMSAEGLVVRPRCDRRAEAFTAPYQGTGLPIGASVVDTVAVAPAPSQIATDKFHNSTLGLHSSRRPPG